MKQVRRFMVCAAVLACVFGAVAAFAEAGLLEQAVGELNKQSEAIATTHDELEILKHKGDRNYF